MSSTMIITGAALFVAGFVQGCTGFGFALVASPCLMFLLGPRDVVPALAMLSLPNSLWVSLDARRHIKPWLVGPLVLGGLAGLPAGVYALRYLDPSIMKALVGLFTVLFACVMLTGWKHPIKGGLLQLFGVGVLSGLLGGSTSVSGPPVILFLTNQDTPKDRFRANIICHFFLTGCAALYLYWQSSMLSWALMGRVILFMPLMFIGTFLGIRLSHLIPEKLFRNAIMVIVVLLGLALAWANIGAIMPS